MKTNTVLFNEDELDILNELINISFGIAASIIGDMIESYAHLHVPNVRTVDIHELDAILFEHTQEDRGMYFTKQRVMGSFEGEVLFSLEQKAATTFTELLLGQEEPVSKEDIQAATLELTNIITSACMGKFGELIQGQLIFSVPTIEGHPKENMLHRQKHQEYSHVILITTSLDIQEKNIWGQMYIMIDNSMLQSLKDILKTFA